jgi:hypothetical protein
MSIVAAFRRLSSACAVFFGPHGSVSHRARRQYRSRQALYREADQALTAVDGAATRARLAELEHALAQRDAQIAALQARLAGAVEVTPDQHAEFAATAQALGVSLSQARQLLAVVLRAGTPSKAALGRYAQAAGRRAGAALTALDAASRGRARQVAADEIFSGRRPILMTLEQDSLCWLGGRLAANRDGPTWAAELEQLPAAEQVTADGGQGLRRGLAQVNRARQRAGRPRVQEQRDHFHALQRARRAVRQARHQAAQALKPAARLQKAYDQQGRAGVPRRPAQGLQLKHAWARAEQAFDRWSAQEQAFARLRRGLRLFTPTGDLNTRAQSEAEVQAALTGQPGAEWARARRLLRSEAFTFLDRVHDRLAALPGDPGLRRAAVRVEGLRQRPEALRGDSPSARAARGVLLAAGLALTLAGDAGAQAQARVRGVLAEAWRASSLVEGLNSVVRMQQARQKRLTQGLLDLKRLYWNLHEFRAGKRKGQSPYGRLGVVLPAQRWWDLLRRPAADLQRVLAEGPPAIPREGQQEVSAQRDAA